MLLHVWNLQPATVAVWHSEQFFRLHSPVPEVVGLGFTLIFSLSCVLDSGPYILEPFRGLGFRASLK